LEIQKQQLENALKFYASVRLDIRRSTQIKDGDNVLGNRTKVKVVKQSSSTI
jgi:recombination protein RecA